MRLFPWPKSRIRQGPSVFINFCPQNANATFKAVKTVTTVDLTVANANVKMDIQEFIVNCQ